MQNRVITVARALFISGPHGVGKTTLCNDIVNTTDLTLVNMDVWSESDADNVREAQLRRARHAISTIGSFSGDTVYVVDRSPICNAVYTNVLEKWGILDASDVRTLNSKSLEHMKNLRHVQVFILPPLEDVMESIRNRERGESHGIMYNIEFVSDLIDEYYRYEREWGDNSRLVERIYPSFESDIVDLAPPAFWHRSRCKY